VLWWQSSDSYFGRFRQQQLFINANMLGRILCAFTETTPILVKVANGQYMQTSKIVKDLTWWSHGATFTTP
jgi:hypothetical protein